ncbi:hypothetical protein ACFV2I_34820 [Streptomyces microflavus]|uniref:hypothetical protein n=1 Tax=Streptomyces TaxID=1883 RepID=UPI0022772FAC|nr:MULTISPECIES: hypothetical protein [Streptomyces]WSR95879.1 hypothetical protein OG728_01590 [Streptomyces microflavus]
MPEQATFATKPHLARDMIAAALDAGTPARWSPGTRSGRGARSIPSACGPQRGPRVRLEEAH